VARPIRDFHSGHLYHVFGRGVNRQDIFRCGADADRFVHLLEKYLPSFAVSILSYCPMPNHYHIGAKGPEISLFMQSVLTAYSCYFNWKYGRTGHVFERRFNAKRCFTNRHSLVLPGYIDLNPVKAGFVKHPRDWRWSSFLEIEGKSSRTIVNVEEFEQIFGSIGDYRSRMEKRLRRLAKRGSVAPANPAMSDFGDPRREEVYAFLDEIAGDVIRGKEIDARAVLQARDRSRRAWRSEFARRSRAEGISMRWIGDYLGRTKQAVMHLIR